MSTFGTTIGSGGFRAYDANHEISYNYVEGVYGGNFQNALMLDSGDAEGNSTQLDAHWRVVNARVERNVLVGNPTGIVIGHNYSLAPTGCTVQDNLVAQAATGTAVTQKITPIATTLANNLYGSTPAAVSLAQGADTIWRRANYGPRLTYLQSADVGVTGDTADTDGTGVLISGSITPSDPTSAADVLGWGSPLPESDEFTYTGAPNSSKWGVYNGPGHDGNGLRSPSRVTVDGSKMVLTGLAGSANSAGLEHKLDQQYGRWEVRCRSYYTTAPPSQTTGGSGGPLTDRTSVSYTNTAGTTSTGHIYAAGLDWTQPVGVLVYTDGSAEFGLKNPSSTYLLAGTNGLIAVAKRHNMVLVTPLAPGAGCDDGDGTCWYDSSGSMTIATKIKWSDDFIQNQVLSKYNINKTRVCIAGYSSGAEFTMGAYGPAYASAWMQDGLLLAISYGSVPFVSPITFTAAFKQNVAAVWDIGGSDATGALTDGTAGYNYYRNAGFATTEMNVVPGVTHDRTGQFGTIVDRELTQYVPAGAAGSSGGYHPVLIVWPTSDAWPGDGEYDFLENGEPGMQAADAFLHYPSLDGANHQVDVADFPVDLRQFHNFAFEWSPNGLKGWVDGQAWFNHSGGAASDRKALQAMPSGHLTVQLDAFQATGCLASTFEIEWARVYTLTPTGSPAGPQTVSPVGIPSGEQFGRPAVTTPNAPAPANSTPSLLGQFTLGITTLGWTLIDRPPPPAGGQTVLVVGIPSGQALGVPAFDVPPGDQIVTVTGIPPTTTFGRPTINGGTPPAPAPGGVLVPALFAVGADGATLTPLPAWVKMHLSPVRNSSGSLSIDYPSGAPGFDLLNSSVSANPLKALEIRVWLGGNNTAALGGWLVQKSGDSLTPGAIWTFSGHFHEWLLTKAIVAPQQISEANKSGALTFAGATAGLILATVMDQAKVRGALPLVARDFTTTTDSNGQPWSKAISSVKFAPKTTLAQIADKLVELGMVEYELSSNQLFRAYNPEGRGVDRSTGLNPVSFAQTFNLKERAHRESSRDAGTAVLVAGSEGFYSFASSPTAQAQLGWRAEVGADAGQLNSQAAVDAVAQNYLEKANSGTAEYAASIVVGPGHRLPLIDYGVGDWALVRVGTGFERQRIAQIELDFEPGTPPSGSVEFNDLITDRLTALYRRLNAISTGDAVVGTSESTPGGPGEDINPPAAPIGVVVASTIAYQQPGETITLALVTVGWAPVINDAYADTETAGKAAAAPWLANRLKSGLPMAADWTWVGSYPQIAATYHAALLEEWKNAPSNDGNTLGTAAREWLTDYATNHLGGGAVTSDVDHYRVQYAYLGGVPVSEVDPASGLIVDPSLSATWIEPAESPTNAIILDFGGVEAGRSVGVRVAAVDRSGNQGPWSAVVAFDSAADNQPPPAPSKPIATAWFRTMDVTWDGKGSSGEDMIAAAPDFLSGGGLEVHVDTGINFTPDRPIGANGTVDLALSRTYRTTLYAAGTTNVTGLAIGTTYYARFVAVDRSGNASDPSETSDGVLPQQLVNIDIGPNAIARAQIIDGEIVRAKIADAAINSLKVEEINVGLLRSGTMSANVVIGGRFETPVVNGNQVQIDNAGIRLYQGNTVVGRWQVADASMLVTGTYLSGLNGERINILTDGTLRFYQAAGSLFSEMSNNGTEVLWRGPISDPGTQQHGYASVSANRVYIGYGTRGALTESHISCQKSNVEIRSPIVGFRVERRFGAIDPIFINTTPRHVFIQQATNGSEYGSYIHLYQNGVNGKPGQSNEQQIIWQGSGHGITGSSGFNAMYASFYDMAVCPVVASAFNVASSITKKTEVAPAWGGDDQVFAAYAKAPSLRWRYKKPGDLVDDADPEGPRVPKVESPPVVQRLRNEDIPDDEWDELPEDHPDKYRRVVLPEPERIENEHIFPTAEALQDAYPGLVTIAPNGEKLVDIRDFAGFMWDTLGRLIPRVTRLEADRDELVRRVVQHLSRQDGQDARPVLGEARGGPVVDGEVVSDD